MHLGGSTAAAHRPQGKKDNCSILKKGARPGPAASSSPSSSNPQLYIGGHGYSLQAKPKRSQRGLKRPHAGPTPPDHVGEGLGGDIKHARAVSPRHDDEDALYAAAMKPQENEDTVIPPPLDLLSPAAKIGE